MITVNASALGWKFPNQPGIRTRKGVLTEWPGALGAFPTQAQADIWEGEYLAAKPDLDAAHGVDGLKALKALVIWLAPLVGKTPAQARDEIITVYKGLP